MKMTVDTNILICGVVRDDEMQARIADKTLNTATLIAIPLPCLCKFVCVLRRVYGFAYADIAAAIWALDQTKKTVMNRPAVEPGLLVLNEGEDFADGIMAYEGSWRGGETFVSFDIKAVSLLTVQGQPGRLL